MVVSLLLKILNHFSLSKKGVQIQFVTHKHDYWWEDEIYDDCIKLFSELATNSNGRITEKSPLVFAAPPAIMVLLSKSTDFGISVMDMLKKYFTDISFVTLPELYASSTNSILMAAKEVDGSPVAQLAYSDKMRAFQLIPEGSSYRQKFCAGTYGCILLRPFAVQIMTGV